MKRENFTEKLLRLQKICKNSESYSLKNLWLYSTTLPVYKDRLDTKVQAMYINCMICYEQIIEYEDTCIAVWISIWRICSPSQYYSGKHMMKAKL